MATPEPNHIISISVKQFPQNLLLPNVENLISLEISNQSNKDEHFKFVFEGENLEIDVKPSEFQDEVKFAPSEAKTINLMLTPVSDGFGKLTINAYWMKLVEYVVKTQHIRKTISTSKINSILKNKQFLQHIEVDIFNINDYFTPSSKNDAKKFEKQLKELIKLAVGQQPEDQAPNGNLVKPNAQVVRGKIDSNLKMLAKSYVSNGEFEKALETALKISNEKERLELYNTLIRVNALKNLDESLKFAKDLKDLKKKKSAN